ncbi:MAG: stage II sporulation protein P [Erysipelotrichales bacterium]|nr:stage II sporulation protein P [Erysipelotrichales bacterium]
MKRRFKAKRKYKYSILIIFLFILIVVLFSFSFVKKVDPVFLMTENYKLFSVNFDRNQLLLKNGLNYKLTEEILKPVFLEETSIKRKVYIYNTHQTEEYVDYDVLSAAKKLKEELSVYNIEVIVEETNIAAEVKKNNYTYSQSYRVTKQLIENIMSDDISLYIDLHRDSSNKGITTTTIGDAEYAKMMFVVGGKHESYMENYRVSNELNKMIKNINENLSRGIILRKTSSYNQEISGNVILIELGGPYNNKIEVENSIKMLAEAINYYMEE